MSEAINSYVKRVKDLAEHVRGNEQATKQSLIGPLLTTLGYDLTDPRECVPEYRADFGKDRSVKPIDWAFFQGGRPIFFVEAKEVGKRLTNYDEQLGDYFAKATDVKLGILTNGVQWRFFTDVTHSNVMDKEPFIKWDVLSDEEPPYDFLTLLHKSQYNPQLIRTFAERKHAQNLLVAELSRLLEPSVDLVRLAVTNIETRMLTKSVLDFWKPVVANALEEWVKQRMLSMVLSSPPQPEAPTNGGAAAASRIETTKEELDGFATAQRLLGADRPIAYLDTVSYFKVHLPERHTWVICRFYFDRKRPCVWFPMSPDLTQQLVPTLTVTVPQLGWSCVNLGSFEDLELLGDVFRSSWDQQRQLRPAVAANGESPIEAELVEAQSSLAPEN
ncbi:hypothetical protein [Singulisphaera sp. PoT]|uniref:hypothetical protein n=1 Tax=Singulisphaera sp. PoT TaxID=3411797 RepID=UPI003BF5B46F